MTPASPRQILLFFFHVRGRISRTEYALGLGVIYSLNAALLVWLFEHGETAPDIVFLMLLPGLALPVALAVVVAKRCHDIGLPGSFFLLCLIPLVGLVWLVALGFLPGNPGPNAYGAPPTFAPPDQSAD